MFEDIRMRLLGKSEYKDIIINSNEKKKKKLLDKYYKVMNTNDVFDILLTMSNEDIRNYLLNKLKPEEVISGDLNEKGLKLLMLLAEEERLNLIKNSDNFRMVESSILLDLILSFNSGKNKIEIINLMKETIRTDMFGKMFDEEVSKIINSNGFNLKERLELINTIGYNNSFVIVRDKSKLLLDLLKGCNDKEKILAIIYNKNSEIRYKKELLEIFKDISIDDINNFLGNNENIYQILKDAGFEFDSNGNMTEEAFNIENINYKYLISNKMTSEELLKEFSDNYSNFKELLKYREDSMFNDELGVILRECFKYRNDFTKFFDYVINDNNNLFDKEFKLELFKMIKFSIGGIPLLSSVKIPKEKLRKLIKQIDKKSLINYINNSVSRHYYIQNMEYNDFTYDEFMTIDDLNKNALLSRISIEELKNELIKHSDLIKFYSGNKYASWNGLKEITDIAMENGYKPSIDDLIKYKYLRTNTEIIKYLVNQGKLEAIEFIFNANQDLYKEKIIFQALESGYKVTENSFKYLGNYKIESVIIAEEIVLNGLYNKYKDRISNYIILRVEALNNIISNNDYSVDAVNKYLDISTTYHNRNKYNPRVINTFLDRGYIPNIDFINKIRNHTDNKKILNSILLKVLKNNNNLIVDIDKDLLDYDMYISLFKEALNKDNTLIESLRYDIEELYKYAVEKCNYKINIDTFKNNSFFCRSNYMMKKAIDKEVSMIVYYSGNDEEVYKYAIKKEPGCIEYIYKQLSEETYKYALDNGFVPTRTNILGSYYLCTSPSIMFAIIKKDKNCINIIKYDKVLEETMNLYFKEFNQDGEIFGYLFYNGKFEIINNLLDKGYKLVPFFDPKKNKILSEFRKIQQNHIKNLYIDYIKKNYDSINFDTIESIVDILYRIENSNSIEIQKFGFDFASMILDTDSPLMSFYKVEDVFVKNNIPYCGKLFSTFKVLHENGKLNQKINNYSRTISPTLKRINNMKYKRNDVLDALIFSDLLKSSLGSNNKSMKEYLYNIERGTLLYKGIITDTIKYDSLESYDKETLSIYAAHLNTLYNNTKEGKAHNRQLVGDTKRDIEELSKLFKVSEIEDLPDRIVSDFGHFLGIKSFKELKNYFEEITRLTGEKNRAVASKEEFKLEVGDFVKGVDSTYLENILQNGSVAKEFLGESSASDATPLDTDLSRITSISETDTIDSIISGTASVGYGDIYLVFKNDGRFSITKESNIESNNIKKTNTHQIEAFYTGICDTQNSKHYGIRTGLSSSNIDYIVVNNYDKRYGFEIARNGFYIPIVDRKTGKLVFTPRDYDELRNRMQGMNYYGIDTYNISNNLNIGEFNLNINDEIITIPSIGSIVSTLENNDEEVKEKRNKIIIPIKEALKELGLKLKTTIDGDVSLGFAELIDTGSTGRGTNVPGDGDFDFMMRLDTEIFTNPERMEQVRETLKEKLKPVDNFVMTNEGDLRLKGVTINGLDNKVDIDISFVKKTNKLSYSTDMALKDRMTNIKKQDPVKYKYVVANIIQAKSLLKKFNVYKAYRSDNSQGGLGGVGVENWILQNNGSLINAINDFLSIAIECETLTDFKEKYHIMDFGENFLAEKKGQYPYDDFICNMSDEGYLKMKSALLKISKELGLINNISSINDKTTIYKDTYNSEEELIKDIEIILKESLNNSDIKLDSANMGQTGKMYEFTIGGITYLVKPGINKNNGKVRPARAEVQASASNLQQLLIPDKFVEVKTLGEGNVKVSVQRKVENIKKLTNEEELIKNYTKELLYEYVIDYLLGNFDSDISNFIIDENNNLLGIDKEQSFKYLLNNDEQSLNLDFSYSPSGSRSNVYPNLLNYIKETGLIEMFKEVIEDIKKKISSIDDKTYVDLFRKYAHSYDSTREEDILEKILERKNNFMNNIDEFIESLNSNKGISK